MKDLKDKKIHLINKHRYFEITVIFLYFRWDSNLRIQSFTKSSMLLHYRGVLRWRDCHCRTCMCDKQLAQCLSSYRCPYDSKSYFSEEGGKKEPKYLTNEDCNTKPINVTGLLSTRLS